MTDDPHRLQRFVYAQDGVFEGALAELRAGRKRGHWMWFIFPQLRGLGQSATAQHYGIASWAEAAAYLAHPVLGPRLATCAGALLALHGRTAHEVLGHPDDLKLCSSMTLFDLVQGGDNPFAQVLERYYGGRRDPHTIELLAAEEVAGRRE